MQSEAACKAASRRLQVWESEAHGLYVVELFDRAYCERTLRRLRRINSWEPAQVSVTEDDDSRGVVLAETRAALTLAPAHAADVHDNFVQKIRCSIAPLVKTIWGVYLPRCFGTQLIRYKKGGHYVVHQDSDEVEFAHRYFTVLCYLNDEFEGGGTDFPSLNHIVRPATGKAVIFPSQYSHAAQPVSQGEKFVILTWMCGPVPVRWI